ncbi:MAG: leucine-rich repeat domain-containing protein [Clostridiaceae bacterium]|nr:leucine-rich repeat domain-containing protein [Clostridiaceae bacterium]
MCKAKTPDSAVAAWYASFPDGSTAYIRKAVNAIADLNKRKQMLFPSVITKSFSIQEAFLIKKHNILFHATEKETGNPYVLKKLSKKYYQKTLYQKIASLTNSHLLLPEQTAIKDSYVYFLYPHYQTLAQRLIENKFTYTDAITLFSNLSDAVNTLHNAKLMHLDITPSNIFYDNRGQFLLGDFSSCRYAGFPPCFCRRTATIPSFLPKTPHRLFLYHFQNDRYQIALLFYALLHNGSLPAEKNINKESDLTAADHILYEFLFTTKAKKMTTKDFFAELSRLLHEASPNSFSFHLSEEKRNNSFFQEATLSCLAKKTNRPKLLFSSLFQKKWNPFFILFILSGCIFLFSIHYSLPQNKTSFKKQNKAAYITTSSVLLTDNSPHPEEKTSPSSSGGAITASDYLNLSGKKFSDWKRISSSDTKILILSENKLTDCHAVCSFPYLEELYLNQNQIASLKGIAQFKKLKVLSLSENKINDITPLNNLPLLNVLDLSRNNHLKNITALKKLSKLRYLILTNTNATKAEIKTLQHKLPHCTILY